MINQDVLNGNDIFAKIKLITALDEGNIGINDLFCKHCEKKCMGEPPCAENGDQIICPFDEPYKVLWWLKQEAAK